MLAKHFTLPAGRIVNVPRGVAFVPDDLPPAAPLEYTAELLNGISEAEHQLGKLDGIAQRLADPDVLIKPFLRREAILSSKIEGTQTSYSDLVLFEAATRTNDRRDTNAQQVANYVQTLDFGLRRCNLSGVVDGNLICDIHKHLMRGVAGEDGAPGKVRQQQVHVRGADISVAQYVPPPPKYLSALLENLSVFIGMRDALPLLIRLAIIHYQFEAIHPFWDGNGRVGRLLVTLMFCVEKRLQYPLLYLSAYFERNSDEYYHRLLKVSQSSDWTSWIMFFVNGVREEAKDAVNRTARLFELRDQFRALFADSRASAPTRLIDSLFETPIMTIPWAQELLNLSYPSAKQVVGKLIEKRILRPLDYRARAQYFVADDIIDIIEQSAVT